MFRLISWLAFTTFTALAAAQADVRIRALQECGVGRGPNDIAYSPDGKTFLTAGDRGAFLWDIETGKLLRTFSGHTDGVTSVAMSRDGSRVLTGSSDGTAKLWDTSTGAELRTFSGHTEIVNTVAFSLDGTLVLTGAGSYFSSSEDNTAKLWDTSTGAELRTFSGHWSGVHFVAFSPDGTRVLTGSYDSTAKLWVANTGAELRTFSGLSFDSFAFSPDGTRVLTGTDSGYPFYEAATAKLWDANTGAELLTFSGHTAGVTSVAFSPDGTHVLTGGGYPDTTARLWNASTGAELRTFSGHAHDINSLAFSPDGTRVLTGTLEGATAKLWDANTGAELRTFSSHGRDIASVAFSPDGTRILAGSWDQTAKLWDANTGAVLRTSHQSSLVLSVAFSPDGTRFLTGGGARFSGTAELWEASTGTFLRNYTPHSGPVSSVAFSPDGNRVLTGSVDNLGLSDNPARLWDANTGVELRTLSPHFGSIFSVAFSSDGSRVLTGSYDGTARIWNANTGDELRTFSGYTVGVSSVAFSPDGTRVLTGAGIIDQNTAAKLWDANTGADLQTFSGHTEGVSSVSFSPDGTRVLTGSDDTTTILWDVAAGTQLHAFAGHTEGVNSVSFSPDGTRVLTGSSDGTSLIWEVNLPRAIVVAGSGDYPGNAIAQQTQDLAAYAFRTLKARGYEGGDIQYLSAFSTNQDADGDGLNDIDGEATLASLEDAITGDFGSGAGRLMVVMIGHGYKTGDFMSFRLNETQALPTTTMKSWLDAVQNAAPVDVTLLVDCCYSGKFAEDCAKDASIPAERERIIIASTSADAEAVFLQPPDLTSFIYTFLGSAYMGNSMGEAFRAGERFFSSFPVANQQPQINDGTAGTDEADREFFGASWAYGVQSTRDVNDFFPVFDEVSPAQTVDPGAPVELYARMLAGQTPESVVAVIRPPAPAVVSGDPVTALPTVQLTESEPGLWTSTITDDTFAEEGVYTISFSARFAFERLSNPAFSSVTVSSGPDPDATTIRAILAVGYGGSPQLDTAFQELGSTISSVYLDRFQDENGVPQPGWITFLSPYSVRFDRPQKDLKDHERNALELLSPKRQMPEASVILDAISDYTGEAGRLYIHLLARDAANGSLILSDTSTLSAADLDAALDTYQAADSTREVVLIIDAPGSGSFVVPCAGPSRIVITSGRDADSAVYIPETRTSFSHKLLAAAWQGNSLQASYISGRNFFEDFLAYFTDPISPQLSDTSSLADDRYLGRRYAFAGDEASGLPFILSGTYENDVITAVLIEGVTPDRVFAQVINTGSDVTNPQTIELARQQAPGETWSAAASVAGGSTIAIYAAYPDDGAEKLSEPYFVQIGPDPLYNGWFFE